MAKCPKCSAPISQEIVLYGGTCPNCFADLDGGIGDDCPDFEPTGMFTPEQMGDLVNEGDGDKVEFTEELLTDEVDLDDLIVFEDEITEVLEITEPIEKENTASNSKETTAEVDNQKETTVETFEVDEDFDFDDEPTIALMGTIEPSYPEPTPTGTFMAVPDIAVTSPQSHKDNDDNVDNDDVELEVALDPLDSDTAPFVRPNRAGVVFDEESEEDFLGVDSEIDEEDLQSMGGIGISPLLENVSVADDTRRPLPKRKTSSMDLKPIVITLCVIVVAAVAIFSKDDKPVVIETEEVPAAFVPEVQKGTLEKSEREPVAGEQKTKVVKKSKASKPTAVEKGGVRTFQTAKPVMTSRPTTAKNSTGGKSAQLERDVTKLKKSLKYCHTRALKTDPTVGGKWEVQFKVTSGSASNIRIKAMRAANAEIESCMKTKIQRFGFTEGQTQNFKFRILFER